MSSQRPSRHQRRASQSVFVLPENLAALDVDAAADVIGGKAGHQDGGAAQQQARPPAGRHRRTMSVAGASRDLELVKEDIGSYKIGA